MWIIGCDLHTRYQQIAAVDTATGELHEQRLDHPGDAVWNFYSALRGSVRVGIEATGYSDWFERLLQKLGHELWVGDPAAIRATSVRQQKTDARDAQQILRLLMQDRFPRIWVPPANHRDARQLLVHRSKLVGLRTAINNQLQALALGQGLRRRRALWSGRGLDRLKALPVLPFAAQRRSDLLGWHHVLEQRISELDQQVKQQAHRCPEAVRLMRQPGVGEITSLAFVLTLGPVGRFPHSQQVVSYLGLIPREHSSGGRQRLGPISKQGNSLMRWLWIEAGQSAARLDPGLKTFYRQLARRRGRNIAKVAVARKLAVRLYWMLRAPPRGVQPVSPQSSPRADMVPRTAEPNS
jgi:transposase